METEKKVMEDLHSDVDRAMTLFRTQISEASKKTASRFGQDKQMERTIISTTYK